MKCHDIQDMMAAFITDDLPMEQSEVIATHIEQCYECRSVHLEVQEMLAEWEGESEFVMADAPDLLPGVMSRIDKPMIVGDVKFPKFSSLYHYSIAASIAFALFYFRFFENIGFDISHSIVFVSDKMQGFAEQISKF